MGYFYMDNTNHDSQNNNITSPNKLSEDIKSEVSLRPDNFDSFIGQNKIVENLKIYIKAAQERNESLDHVLLFGPPGLGKTTLANIISKELMFKKKSLVGHKPLFYKLDDIEGFDINTNYEFEFAEYLFKKYGKNI